MAEEGSRQGYWVSWSRWWHHRRLGLIYQSLDDDSGTLCFVSFFSTGNSLFDLLPPLNLLFIHVSSGLDLIPFAIYGPQLVKRALHAVQITVPYLFVVQFQQQQTFSLCPASFHFSCTTSSFSHRPTKISRSSFAFLPRTSNTLLRSGLSLGLLFLRLVYLLYTIVRWPLYNTYIASIFYVLYM